MVVAHTRGLLRPIRYNDRKSKIRELMILSQIQREIYGDLEKLKYQKEVSQIQYTLADPEGEVRKHHSAQARQSYLRYLGYQIPDRDWDKYLADEEVRSDKQDVETWENMFGKLDDPETQKEIDKAIEWLKNN